MSIELVSDVDQHLLPIVFSMVLNIDIVVSVDGASIIEGDDFSFNGTLFLLELLRYSLSTMNQCSTMKKKYEILFRID